MKQPVPSNATGSSYVEIIGVNFTIVGTVETFNVTAFEENLLALYPNAVGVTTSVQPASVVVSAGIIYDNANAANTDYTTIAAATPAELSSSLKVTVEARSSPSIEARSEQSPPSQQPRKPKLQAEGIENGVWTDHEVVSFVSVTLVLPFLGVALVRRCRRAASGPARSAGEDFGASLKHP